MSKGVTKLMAERLGPDRIDEYIQNTFQMEEYQNIRAYFYSLKENYPDVLYMYVTVSSRTADMLYLTWTRQEPKTQTSQETFINWMRPMCRILIRFASAAMCLSCPA